LEQNVLEYAPEKEGGGSLGRLGLRCWLAIVTVEKEVCLFIARKERVGGMFVSERA